MTVKRQKKERKPLIINAFAMLTPILQSNTFAVPENQAHLYNSLDYWIELAKLLEKGKFNALFLADVLGPYDVYKSGGTPNNSNIAPVAISGAQWPINEPSAYISAMAAVTKNLSFAITFATISEAPYHFARRLATLDHLTKGRIGWNIVSSYLNTACKNLLNGQPLPDHDERYEKTQEYLEVIYQLFLSSWADDAVKLDKTKRIYTDPNKIREINFDGKHYKVPGPFICEPNPYQRIPAILQAGASTKGLEFAARNAESIFINGSNPHGLKSKIDKLTALLEKNGRKREDVKLVQLATLITAPTHEEAVAKLQHYKKYADLDGTQALFGGWTGIDLDKYDYEEELDQVESNAVRSMAEMMTKPFPGDPPNLKKTRRYVAENLAIGGSGIIFVGTPQEIADQIEEFVDISTIDGFNFCYAVMPDSFKEIVELIIPELQKRGLVWEDYPKTENLTFRENIFGLGDGSYDPTYLKPNHPAYDLRWTKDTSKEEFESKLKDTLKQNF
ncbi:uncharacterized protein KGF55_000319 [Candida pseudojiufengensis]|uniref:uncharacterized protein n=1 Tax=Candida pseudojiufengensis TaxID=497109 RepID=UPI0022259219|nr:uncharacterized protein KGF55_000319 [Candida pseudojiufengensis]KAI5966910.1 hypothetical protein KGF55_000319 [Candida pseudojiufengensis]